MSDVAICDVGGGGGLFLGKGDQEQTTAKPVRAVFYLAALFYMFMAVNSAADYFMSAVENITSKRIRVPCEKDSSRTRTAKRWNDTVANLTLLALGSSAPEILLSCIEIAGNKFYSGALGPGTIVGSAAFNLLVIISVCIISIPEGEIRAIKATAVYHLTVLFSCFAYFWLLLIVTVISPDVIDLWEALFTLSLFSFLVVICYFADIGKLEFMSLERKPCQQQPGKAVEGGPAPGDVAAGPPAQAEEHLLETHAGLERAHRASGVHPRVRQASAHIRRASKRNHGSHEDFHESAEERRLGEEPVGARVGDGVICVDGKPIQNAHGVITFCKDTLDIIVKAEPIEYEVEVLRRNGSSGAVSCKIRTSGLTAVEGCAFEPFEKTLTFTDGEVMRIVTVTILPKRKLQKDTSFQLIMEDLEGGAQFNPCDDGEEDEAYFTFNLVNGWERTGNESCFSKFMERLIDWDSLYQGLDSWKEQIQESFTVEGGDDDPPREGPSASDYIIHIITLPWKVLFALVAPPATWLGGWLLFVAALCYIGAVTAVISDLASLFGCVAGIPDEVTAITLVALGTSLPDMFASMSAAKADDTADASVVNVTGSNSVNVFLGIGLPWTTAAAYWKGTGASQEWQARYPDMVASHPNGAFVVKGGTLGFSVAIFVGVAVIALVLLRIRRVRFHGELGGPKIPKRVSSVLLLSLWFSYVGLSIWRSRSDDAEVMKIPVLALAVVAILTGIGFEIMRHAAPSQEEPTRNSEAFLSLDAPANKLGKSMDEAPAIMPTKVELFGEGQQAPALVLAVPPPKAPKNRPDIGTNSNERKALKKEDAQKSKEQTEDVVVVPAPVAHAGEADIAATGGADMQPVKQAQEETETEVSATDTKKDPPKKAAKAKVVKSSKTKETKSDVDDAESPLSKTTTTGTKIRKEGSFAKTDEKKASSDEKKSSRAIVSSTTQKSLKGDTDKKKKNQEKKSKESSSG